MEIFSPSKKKKILTNEGEHQYVVKIKVWRFVTQYFFVIDDEKNKGAKNSNKT